MSEKVEIEGQLRLALSSEIEADLQAGALTDIPGRDELKRRAEAILERMPHILTRGQRAALVRTVVDHVVGLGPLEPLLADPNITEIMVNDARNVFVECGGVIERRAVAFHDEAHLRHVIDRMVAPLGRRVDESSPLVDARLPDGSRVNVIIPPLALNGPTITIRKFSPQPFSLDRLTALGTLSPRMGTFLEEAVRQRVSLIVSGGTGSGKTSTLNALGLCIPAGERLITIEDAAELRLQHPHIVSLEARPPNLEGQGEIPIRTLVRNALRMRPDRIIVGEVRGGEAFDMLQAMNTGHRGSLTTLHANSPADALIRLESMVLMAGLDLAVAAIRRMIAGAIGLIVQQDRLPDGRRVVTAIAEVVRGDSGEIGLRTRFVHDARGAVSGERP
ncbi:MAG TPA: CpaF family protein [Anaerolineales bacterium]|nr:CpaF family protein [Anaerolineales bacterium]